MHEKFMQLALDAAIKGLYATKPNPAVGCVIVKNQKVIATGYHVAYGQAHAEIMALKQVNFDARGCDICITLEPCAHHGKTPPCVESIIKSGANRVIIPFADPNPLTCGQSIMQLKRAGIDVITNVLSEKCYNVNRFFLHYMQYRRPYIIAKWAMTDTGKFSVANQQWISHEQSRAHTHLLRQRADAIIIGANTLRIDNPRLTTRTPSIAPENITHPLRIVLTTQGNFSFEQQIFNDTFTKNTLIACMDKPSHQLLEQQSMRKFQVLALHGSDTKNKLKFLVSHLAQKNIMSLIVEGGKTLLDSFFSSNLIDEVQCYIAKKNASTRPLENFIQLNDYRIQTIENIACDTFIKAKKETTYV
ncbi:MAG: riboflavin biosynthesis protein RibD [Legionellales bacterium]|nr:riboflavin biosynthesis protein RibD [Legionellales bacterium]